MKNTRHRRLQNVKYQLHQLGILDIYNCFSMKNIRILIFFFFIN